LYAEKRVAQIDAEKAFMTISSYALNFIASDKEISPKPKAILPDQNTYKNVRIYADFFNSEVEQGHTVISAIS
jgi:hypothetical protein